MPSSATVISQKTRAATAAAKPGPKTRGAVAKAPAAKAPATKVPVHKAASKKKEVDLKALALQKKKETQQKTQQTWDEVSLEIRRHARAMREAQNDNNNDITHQVLDGPGDHDLDGHGNSVPPLDEEEQNGEDNQDLDAPLDEDPNEDTNALLFNLTFEGQGDGHGDDDNDNDEEGATAAVSVPGGDDDDSMDVDFPTNNMQVSSAPSTPSKKASARAHRGLSSSPSSSRSRSSLSANILTPPARHRGGKITEKHFTPKTRRLAILGKKMNRRSTAIKQPFPVDKHSYNMEILQDLANEYKGEDNMIEVFARVLASVDTQQELVQFLGYARSGFFTNCMAKAREWVSTRFGIPGKMRPTEVRDLVAWLLQDGHYKYGDVDTELKTYDTKLPFGCEGVAHILRLEVFSTKGGANIEIFREIVNVRKIAPTTVALMLTFIEHAIQEYSEGVHRHVEFSDTARPHYCYHLSSFNRIAKKALIWADNFGRGLYKLILTQSNKEFLLDVEADDLTEVDIEGLEAEAAATSPLASGGASPLPSSSPPCSSPVCS
ncbi:hypothetical protein BDP27DRAFT_1476557 [Rhodocollybia butyracea]|uniref:DUF6532 domain-containing protein n=1 Tax=Rhodocollybia butyracea TaxID=206335 RepID=A0A9P5PI00_9AGAR|nr:hypothetical protein BDP27DRAFT_1476557 [Rhodocollybia butyracea]